MALLSSNSKDSSSCVPSGSRDSNYCRKQKSLGLLCSNFLSLYDRDGIDTIGLDDAAARLGVERRRIYDIVNVLESIGLLTKKAKNRYSWKGFGVIPKTLQLLKQEGLKESYTSFEDPLPFKVLDDEVDEKFQSSNNSSQTDKSNASSVPKIPGLGASKSERKEKSLGLLTQNFVKLFLCSEVEMISLDEAAKILLGDAHDMSMMRNNSTAKVRRLYDIANVLSSMNFIEKTHHPETRKPAFRWLGMKGKSQMASTNALILESKKRTFGTELTNTSLKRCRGAPSLNTAADQATITPSQIRAECMTAKKAVDVSDSEKGSLQNVQNYHYGPFAPINVLKTQPSSNDERKQPRDWESLAKAHTPQYHNQALRDLFCHYMEAWGSWCSEVAGKNPIQLQS
ncbi:E2F transcription factor-like E2FE isoform X2 [Daucus carota subsp. sativus]|uniref:E2F transcription factor-like E2FE isoform X2 n=1 Tax=Daucus carota subsp. sativus TaxID=79200 RepID=UPI0007EF2CA6|nr:PREDICTED: E2F transcription factor-like E2FE isoform X1 [Daucus carota subsp. sativus]